MCDTVSQTLSILLSLSYKFILINYHICDAKKERNNFYNSKKQNKIVILDFLKKKMKFVLYESMCENVYEFPPKIVPIFEKMLHCEFAFF